MASSVRAGDVLASRYRMVDLLAEADGGWFWNAHDKLLHRPVAIHLLDADDPRSEPLLRAARRSAALSDRRILRVLDCNLTSELCYVVNEWGNGTSLDIALEAHGPMTPVRAAWLVQEVADTVAVAHASGATHGRLVPENVLIDENGEIRIIGFGVETALHRLPGTEEDDLDSLASLLYATLTGRWPGRIPSVVPAAPREAGRFLRPRQVRAGIPRPLDQICDEVLNGVDAAAPANPLTSGLGLGAVLGREHVHITTAAHLRDALGLFVGAHEPDLGPHVRPTPDTVVPVERPWTPPDDEEPLPPLPAFGSLAGVPEGQLASAHEDGHRNGSAHGSAPDAATPAQGTAVHTDLGLDPSDDSAGNMLDEDDPAAVETTNVALGATEAGLPVFDDDEVEWVRTRAAEPRPAAVPPPEPARPLFVPESESGSRGRHLRGQESSGTGGSGSTGGTGGTGGSGSTGGSGATHAPPRLPEEYWPWDSTNPGAATSSGVIPVVPGAPVPGRRWMRLAWLVGIAALLLLGGVAAWQWSSHSDRPASNGTATPTGSPSPTQTTGPLEGLTAKDLDPQGDPPEEYPEQAPLAVDDDPQTFWGTQTYKQQFGPDGLKQGVGLVVDLGEARDVLQVQVSVLGGETEAEVYVSDEAPTDVADLEPVQTTSGADLLTFTFDEVRPGRFVTVWLTKVPTQDGGFRGKVAEIDVFA